MSRPKEGQLLRASILDRLIDKRPDQASEPEKEKYQFMNEVRDGVRRDLETLLNTRYRGISLPEKCYNLDDSLLNYGLPDLNTFNFVSSNSRKEFCMVVEDHIKKFEPRFKSVHVSIPDDQALMGDGLNFRIEALMYADRAPEEIIFNSSLEPITNIVQVTEVH